MKQLNLFDGSKIPITDEEAKGIKENVENIKFFNLRNGDMINVSSISSITEIETEAYWKGYKLNKTGDYFIRDGERIYLEAHNYHQIDYIPIFDSKEFDELCKLENSKRIEEKKEEINTEGLKKLENLKSGFSFGKNL